MGLWLCRDTCDRASDRCLRCFPCLSDPGRRSSLCLKLALVVLHLVYAGILFIFDRDLIEKTKQEPWYTALYLLLFVATLSQYFFTSGSSPGYVLDAMRDFNEADALFSRKAMASKQTASSKNGDLVVTVDRNQLVKPLLDSNAMSWTKLVMDMYPPGTSVRPQEQSIAMIVTNVYFNSIIIVWYIFEETVLCLWTGILYITYLKANMTKEWWVDVIMILLLASLSISLIFLLLLLLFHSYLVTTNQTTYELVRRRRIPYLRGIPERVKPFSKGLCRNLYNFCCARSSIYTMEPLPSALELEEKSKPYTCVDTLSCRCCC
ncbi:hypothetical protein RJ639_005179 [Escallonia herrerae]|uniref:protein S-acyltransferase n=1 Tax=Escallonia herrerae TaxID=1293975 RepID=A0AA88W1B7_9ASTE|nr:hypothetical protein RJ639_005179 [Escallonia herrerae]